MDKLTGYFKKEGAEGEAKPEGETTEAKAAEETTPKDKEAPHDELGVSMRDKLTGLTAGFFKKDGAEGDKGETNGTETTEKSAPKDKETTGDGLPAALTVPYLVGTANGVSTGKRMSAFLNNSFSKLIKKEATAAATTPEDPKKFLQDNGVVVTEEDSDEDIEKAVTVVQDPVFWQKHASLHPQKGRSKMWLWVHDRYRVQAEAMLALKDDPSKQLAAFQKFHAKIKAHSEFEDEQLFKFFLDSKIGNQSALEELKKQHGDIRLVTEITEGLEKCQGETATDKEKKAVQDKVEAYVNDLKSHLDLEEKTITGPWLQLTPEQYKTYRTYLSWTYCFMY